MGTICTTTFVESSQTPTGQLYCSILSMSRCQSFCLQCFHRKSIRPLKKWWDAGVVICLQRGAHDLHMGQLMPLPPHYLLLH